ncbi:MAG: thiamine pyrophosphate-binding protein, partial [Sphingomonas taxi]
MAQLTSDFFVERLKAWGVTRIYGYPGDGINGVLGALQRVEGTDDGIEFIQVRHEEMAAFMATAHAKFTGELGVCLSTGGPGATHLITGLYDAKSDHVPVLAIAGQAETTVRGASYQQELNLDRMFADVADFVQEAAVPAQLRHLVDRGLRVATARNGVTVLVLPKDVQDMPWEEPKRAHGFTRSGPGYARPRIVPHDADLARAAEVLNAGRKVAIVIGAGARDAADEVVAVAERLGAGVAKALLGKDVLPDDLPFVTGAIGLLGTKPSSDMMEGCDTLLMIGTGLPLGRVPAHRRAGARRPDRHRTRDAGAALPGRGEPARRRRRDAACVAAVAAAAGGPRLAGRDRPRHGRLARYAKGARARR